MTKLCFHQDDVTHELISAESGESGNEEAGSVGQLQGQTRPTHPVAAHAGSRPSAEASILQAPSTTPSSISIHATVKREPPAAAGAGAVQVDREEATPRPSTVSEKPLSTPSMPTYAGIAAKSGSTVSGLTPSRMPSIRPARPYAGVAAVANSSRAAIERMSSRGTAKLTGAPTSNRTQPLSGRATAIGSSSSQPNSSPAMKSDTSKKSDSTTRKRPSRRRKRISSRLTES